MATKKANRKKKPMSDGPNNPAILERDYRLIAGCLRRMLAACLEAKLNREGNGWQG